MAKFTTSQHTLEKLNNNEEHCECGHDHNHEHEHHHEHCECGHEHHHEHEHCECGHDHHHEHEHHHEHCECGHEHHHEHHHEVASTPEEALAMLKYMLHHNQHHAEELHELSHCFEAEISDLIHDSVDKLNESNSFIEQALALLDNEL